MNIARTRVRRTLRAERGRDGGFQPPALLLLALWGLCLSLSARAQELPRYDPRQDGWAATHHVAEARATDEGLLIRGGGPDPYLHGPARDFPAGQPLWMRLRLKSSVTGTGQVFYYAEGAATTETNSVRFPVRGGRWETVRVPLPALGPRTRLRFDPPGGAGDTTLLAELAFEPRTLYPEPDWTAPPPPDLDNPFTIRSGRLTLKHGRDALGAFAVEVDGARMATGHARPRVGYLRAGQVRWLDLVATGRASVSTHHGSILVRLDATDEDGVKWTFLQSFTPRKSTGAIDVEAHVLVSRERQILCLPVFVLLPGVGAFGERKNQALFAGVEYLGRDEPSSSEADLIGPEAKRQIPEAHKITFPLMAVQHDGRYVGLTWKPDPRLSALFDSPDRVFKAGGHAMGLLFPGTREGTREPGRLLPYEPQTLKPNELVYVRATILGGRGDSVIPAVQQYVALRGLPPPPKPGLDWQGYLELAAAGWRDSKIREGALFRHAFWPGFSPQPAADAVMCLNYLLNVGYPAWYKRDPQGFRRLVQETLELDGNRTPEYLTSAVSHVRPPAPGLTDGSIEEVAVFKARQARAFLARFEADGTIRYRPGKKDYGTTHNENHANGHTAATVAAILEGAALSGDPDLRRDALAALHKLDRYDNTVPRGAQTWEIPLHTPDILASAHLVRAYVLGYELSGDAMLLERAKTWAWTGVPFVYLTNPTGQAVGTYATISVLGATDWVAPVWLGQPVQWCGLVYADALYQLSRHDAKGPWKKLADGITASGIQQTWKRDDRDRQGLLPDFFLLDLQMRDGPAINPGTVMFNAVRYYGKTPLYDRVGLPKSGLILHAPGAIRDVRETPGRVVFTVQPWLYQKPRRKGDSFGCYMGPPTHSVLIAGLKQQPRVRINGEDVNSEEKFRDGRLTIWISEKSRVEIDLR